MFRRPLHSIAMVLILWPATGAAYVDPGTGSTSVGSLSPLIAGLIVGVLVFCLKLFWKPLRRWISGESDDLSEDE